MAKNSAPELCVEDTGTASFISLIECKGQHYLCIIDRISQTEITAYVLDFAEAENIPIHHFLSIANIWFYGSSDRHPLSVELAKKGLTDVLSPIYKTFDINFVSRVVGTTFEFADSESKIKRRRAIPIAEGTPIRLKKK
jgi:hypothetical protein